jgi:hypothetical protein
VPSSPHIEALPSSSSPTQLWRRNSSFPSNPPPLLPEYVGGSPEDITDELLHHLLHLSLAGDQGEGHPQASSSLPQAPMEELSSIYSNAALRQQAAHCSCSTRHR